MNYSRGTYVAIPLRCSIIASVVVLFPYTNRPVKRPHLNPRAGVWDLCPVCCCQNKSRTWRVSYWLLA